MAPWMGASPNMDTRIDYILTDVARLTEQLRGC